MITRRALIYQAARYGIAAAATGAWIHTHAVVESSTAADRMQLPIKGAIRRDSTIVRVGGNGDDFLMTWAADGRQLVAVQDGQGWFEEPRGEYNSRLWAVTGGPQNASFRDVSGYPELMNEWHTENIARYYGFGTLALDGHIYQYLSTPAGPPGSAEGGWIGAKLIYSPDNGVTWLNQDGSTPVFWEPWHKRSRDNMVFFREPQNAFSLVAILQMGRNYEANRDGYIYVYSPNGMTDGTMNQLVMFRVPKGLILQRSAYEYFAGLRSDGNAVWSKDIQARAIVYVFPRGWVNTPGPVESWLPSVVYIASRGIYLMANWGVGCGPDGHPFGKPSYLGFWIAQNPWGPWTQIHEETAWTPGLDMASRCYAPQIAPAWIAADGRSFWLVWTDYQSRQTGPCRLFEKKLADFLSTKGVYKIDRKESARFLAEARQCNPYYAFNAQRVDLIDR